MENKNHTFGKKQPNVLPWELRTGRFWGMPATILSLIMHPQKSMSSIPKTRWLSAWMFISIIVVGIHEFILLAHNFKIYTHPSIISILNSIDANGYNKMVYYSISMAIGLPISTLAQSALLAALMLATLRLITGIHANYNHLVKLFCYSKTPIIFTIIPLDISVILFFWTIILFYFGINAAIVKDKRKAQICISFFIIEYFCVYYLLMSIPKLAGLLSLL